MTASHAATKNAGADSMFAAVTFFVHDAASQRHAHGTRARVPPPLPDNMSALARTTASALRAPRLAGALRCGKRCAAIESEHRLPDGLFGRARIFYVPKRRATRRRGHEATRDRIAPAESHDARARASPISVAARAPPLRLSAPNAPRVEFALAAAPRVFSVRWSLRERKGFFFATRRFSSRGERGV